MGAVPSKETPIMRRNTPNFTRLSRNKRSSKHDLLQPKLDAIDNVKTEIDLFAGDRRSERYSQIQQTLAMISTYFQEEKNASTKPKIRNKCDEALGEIQTCLKQLETRVEFNEQNLDSAAVESHSFINHSFRPQPLITPDVEWTQNLPPPSIQKKRTDTDKTLDRIEQETDKLEQDIKHCIELEDLKQFKFFEKKIQILYTDLEMINVDNYTPLAEQKAAVGKRLIKCNNSLKKSKRTSLHVIASCDRKLEKLEVQALTFDGIKSDKQYKELKQELESYWTTLYPLQTSSSEEKRRKDVITEKIKNTLEELLIRAEENERQYKAIDELNEQCDKVKNLEEKALNYEGSSSDATYLEIDQELRSTWAKISEIEDVNEHVRRNKERVISGIQNTLKTLNGRAKKPLTKQDSKEGEIEEAQLHKQVKEFQIHWEQLNYNLEISKIVNSEVSKSITTIFRNICNGITMKTNALETIEKRKSTSSLVVAKMIEDVGKIHSSNVTKAQALMETEINVQPSVKAIGQIERIGLDAKSILQQIRQSSCVKNDTDYKNFQSKLEECKTALERLEYNKRSDTIESNKKRAMKTVNEALRILQERPTPKLNTATASSKSFEVIDVYAEIQYYRQQIKLFSGVTKDQNYIKVKQGLSDCLAKLQLIDDDQAVKQENIRHIQQYHQELESKLAENQAKVKIIQQNAEFKRQASRDTKNIIENVQKLKAQVERFVGVYDGLQYKQLEENLIDCTKKLDAIDANGDERLQSAKIETKQKIRKYLRILEERSTKPEMVPDTSKPQETPHKQINTLRDKLVEIKAKTEEFTGKYKDEEYESIELELSKCMEEIQLIDDQGHKSIVISKEQYEDYIVKLFAYFEEKSKTIDTVDTESQAFKIMDPTEDLAIIEKKIMELRDKVDKLHGTTSEDQCNDLRQTEASLRKLLANIEVGNVAHVRERKKQLLENLEGCIVLLESKRTNFKNDDLMKKVDEITQKIEETSESVRNFVGVKNDKNYCHLDEVLIQLMIQLDNIDYSQNPDLKQTKKNAIQLIQRNMMVLNKQAVGGVPTPTVV